MISTKNQIGRLKRYEGSGTIDGLVNLIRYSLVLNNMEPYYTSFVP